MPLANHGRGDDTAQISVGSGRWNLLGAAESFCGRCPIAVCRYLLGLAYPAYVTVNALESPGTQDDHLVRLDRFPTASPEPSM